MSSGPNDASNAYGMRRATVPRSYAMVPKSVPVRVSTGPTRECVLANACGIPFDYVPPPEGELMMTVPFKWPADEEWSRMPNW